jgi:predicted nucleic acid-binding protein
MQIVSDTSPLIIFKKSGAMQILGKLFNEVIIADKVRGELYRKEKGFFEKVKFIKTVEVRNRDLVRVLAAIVDEGEAEAIALALEKKHPSLIDDLKGRRLAEGL